jgi:CubicO group peptidase (beta-lactamase class C family)
MVLRIKKVIPLSFIFFCLSLASCNVVRYVYWNYATVKDYKKFPVDTIRALESSPHITGKLIKNPPDPIGKKRYIKDTESLDQFLEKHKTLAFLILRNDTLIYEKYFKGYNKNSIIPSFSVAKSFVSALVGIAVSEGAIRDIHQPVTDYIPEMKDPGFHKVTIEDLLDMRSGIKFNEGYKNPFGEAAKFYYGLNLKRYTLKLKVVHKPGSFYNYQSGNVQILGMILEKATGKRLSEYLEEKIWKPMGAGHLATWSLDSKKFRDAKAFCCINAVPQDFALFGQLYLKNGVSAGNDVVPANWIKESLTIRNDSKDSQGYPYTYLWRVMENGSYFAKGIMGQFIFICPKKNIVIVRMGESAEDLDWPAFFQMIADQL